MKEHLKDLHYIYVIVPIDNVASNAAFIHQQFYALALIKELGLLDNSNNTNQPITYKEVIILNLSFSGC